MSHRSSPLIERTEKARSAALFARVLEYDKAGHVRVVLVPGTQGKQYQVILWRAHGGQYQAECNLLVAGGGNLVLCKGNSETSTVCYHVLAALMVAAKESHLRFCESAEHAARLARLFGRVITVASRSGAGKLYGVVS